MEVNPKLVQFDIGYNLLQTKDVKLSSQMFVY